MSFEWMEYWELAKGLTQTPPNVVAIPLEARYRCSVSRTYYAVFCAIRDHFQKLPSSGLTLTGAGRDHRILSDWLQHHSSPNLRRMGHLLESLRGYRNWMDYVTEIPSPSTKYRSVQAIHAQSQRWMEGILRCMEIARIQ